MSWVGVGVTVAGMVMQAQGSAKASMAARATALRKQQADEFEAKQLEQNAGQAIAASQRVALDRARDARYVQSRALAVAAASGGGVSDPTVVNLIGRIAGEGAYRQGLALYEGEDRARAMRMAAATKRFEGTMAIEEGDMSADAFATQGMGSLVKGGASLFSKYGGKGPSGGSGDSSLLQQDFSAGYY